MQYGEGTGAGIQRALPKRKFVCKDRARQMLLALRAFIRQDVVQSEAQDGEGTVTLVANLCI